MDKPLIQLPIQIRPSLVSGRGVFAKKSIEKGDIIEECPVILFNQEYKSIENYYFRWSEKEDINALPLGYALLYNHADTPNAEWRIDPDKNLFIIRALYNISSDDEIFVDYSDKWFQARKLVKTHNLYKRIKRYFSYAIKTTVVILILFAIRWVVTHVKFTLI